MNLTQFINFYQKYLLLVDEIKDISDLNEFYENYFDELKSISKVRVWQTFEWKEKRKEIISKNSFCVKCGSSENLVLQHTIPYPGRFFYLKQFYGNVKFNSCSILDL
jgi:ribosomal protein S27AE